MHRRQGFYKFRNTITSFFELECRYDRLLQNCDNLITLKQLHSSLTTLDNFIRQSPHLGAQIIIKYSKFGDPNSARSLFDHIHHGPTNYSFLWNTMLRAYANGGHVLQTLELYILMRKKGIQPNNYTFPFVLKVCASESLSIQGRLVHCDIVRTGFDSDTYVEAALVDMYPKCGLIEYGRKVFDRMSKKDLVSWTAMITAYEQAERAEDALSLFLEMQKDGFLMDSVAAVSVASAIGQLGDAKKGQSLHGFVITNGFSVDVCVGNSIIAMYSKCGNVEKARLVFDSMRERDGITWNSMLSGYTQNGLASEALLLFDQMKASGSKPSPITALIMVSACASLGSKQIGRELHNFIIDTKIKMNTTLWNSIMDMYSKCGDLETAVEMFNRSHSGERNVSSWNVLISGYGIHGCGKAALELYSRMQEEGVKPNHITFTTLLSACSHSGLVNEGRKCFTEMSKFSVIREPKHYACMVDMLGRAGLLHKAYDLIKDMPSQSNDGAWGALLLACRIHGNTELGEIAANNLFQTEPEHSGYYVLMSNIYAASTKWQEVGKLRQDMKTRGLRKLAAFSLI